MTIATRVVAFGVIGALAAAVAPARAQGDEAEAETLFREGKRLMKKGELAEACKRFEASERIDPGIGTELNLGDCLDKNHQTASAWAMFLKAAASAKRAGGDGRREAEARRRAALLQKELVFLTIDVPDDHRVPGLQIKRGDEVLDETLWGQATPVDPDDYTITAEAEGYTPWSEAVSVKTKNKHVEVPALDKVATASHPQPVDTTDTTEHEPAHVTHRAAPTHEPVPPPPPESHVRRAPLALAIGGVIGIGAGIALGLLSNHDENDSNNVCMQQLACPYQNGLDLNSRARAEALGADLGFGLGGAALVTAVVWWLVAGPTATDRVTLVPTLDAGHVGLAAAGHF